MATRAPMTYANRVVPATSLTKAVNISATLLAAVSNSKTTDMKRDGRDQICAACTTARRSGDRAFTNIYQR